MRVFNIRSIIAGDIVPGGIFFTLLFIRPRRGRDSCTHTFATDLRRVFPILSELSNRGTLRLQNTPADSRTDSPSLRRAIRPKVYTLAIKNDNTSWFSIQTYESNEPKHTQ